ncbi:MAG: hypothetical protein ACON4F_02625 [Candidatus Puniceispirillaceae bacterium]
MICRIFYLSILTTSLFCSAVSSASDLELSDCFADPDSCLEVELEDVAVASDEDKDKDDEEATTGLTIPSGHVLSDGQLFESASPETREFLKRNAQNGGEKAGLINDQVFVFAGDDLVFVPVVDLIGKSTKQIKNIITASVVNDVTDLDLDLSTLAENLEENKGDVEAAVVETIEETVALVSTGQMDEIAQRSDKLSDILNAANNYYASGFSERDIAQAVKAADEAANALPADIQTIIDEVIDNAVEAIQVASSDIDAALRTWDSLSDKAKQAIVNEANRLGALGCGGQYKCSVTDAENYADQLR